MGSRLLSFIASKTGWELEGSSAFGMSSSAIPVALSCSLDDQGRGPILTPLNILCQEFVIKIIITVYKCIAAISQRAPLRHSSCPLICIRTSKLRGGHHGSQPWQTWCATMHGKKWRIVSRIHIATFQTYKLIQIVLQHYMRTYVLRFSCKEAWQDLAFTGVCSKSLSISYAMRYYALCHFMP